MTLVPMKPVTDARVDERVCRVANGACAGVGLRHLHHKGGQPVLASHACNPANMDAHQPVR